MLQWRRCSCSHVHPIHLFTIFILTWRWVTCGWVQVNRRIRQSHIEGVPTAIFLSHSVSFRWIWKRMRYECVAERKKDFKIYSFAQVKLDSFVSIARTRRSHPKRICMQTVDALRLCMTCVRNETNSLAYTYICINRWAFCNAKQLKCVACKSEPRKRRL